MANGPFEDPVLYVDLLFEKRALLFDAGNLRRLPAKKLMRVSDLFVSHAHMDHFSDFDWLLRLRVGRQRPLNVYGPDGFIERTVNKLAAYSWDLVRNYEDDFLITVTEVGHHGQARRTVLRCRDGFRRSGDEVVDTPGGTLADEPGFKVRCAVFDHSIPVLGFCIEEKQHVNVWKNRLDELGLPVGPWLRDLKRAVLESRPDDTPIPVAGLRSGSGGRAPLALGFLKERVLRIVPGQKVGYLVDVAYSEANRSKAIELMRECDQLFIESAFAHDDAAIAAKRNHLTAHQAGTIAGMAGVKRVIPIHFSPRYTESEARLREEVLSAFAGHP
jgi:ribonuclease Z